MFTAFCEETVNLRFLGFIESTYANGVVSLGNRQETMSQHPGFAFLLAPAEPADTVPRWFT